MGVGAEKARCRMMKRDLANSSLSYEGGPDTFEEKIVGSETTGRPRGVEAQGFGWSRV